MKVTLNGKEFECSLGLGFLGEAIDSLNLSYDTLFEKYEKNPIKYVPLLMFESVKYAKDLDGEEIDFTKKEFFEWIEKDGGVANKELVKFSQAFIESITKNVPKEEVKEGTKKK